jgi:hypothetical protein
VLGVSLRGSGNVYQKAERVKAHRSIIKNRPSVAWESLPQYRNKKHLVGRSFGISIHDLCVLKLLRHVTMDPIEIPPEVQLDPNAKELARLWSANKKLNASINVGIFATNGKDEAGCWGVLLSDFTRNVARALSQRYGANEEQVVA